MNINELSSNIYGASLRSIQPGSYSAKTVKEGMTTETGEKFSDILSSYALSGDADELVDNIKSMENSLDEEDSSDVNKSNVMNILTDAHIAKEYLESQSGRNLIVSMAENQIASIVSGNYDDEE